MLQVGSPKAPLGGASEAANAAIAPQAQISGAVLREIEGATPGQNQSLSGVSQLSNHLNSLLGQTPTGSAPTGYSDARSADPGTASAYGAVARSANVGSVRYLRDQGDELGAGRGKVALASALSLPAPSEDPKIALKSLTTFVKENPTDDKALAKRAQTYNSLKKYKEAEADALMALQQNPNNAMAWSQLAYSLLKQGRYKDALACIERAILANPRSAANYAIRAFIRSMLGDQDGAMKDMEMAASMDPRYRAKLEAFKNGAKLYDPNEDEEVGVVLAAQVDRLPFGIGLALLAALGLAGYYARKVYARRKNAQSVALRKIAFPTAEV